MAAGVRAMWSSVRKTDSRMIGRRNTTESGVRMRMKRSIGMKSECVVGRRKRIERSNRMSRTETAMGFEIQWRGGGVRMASARGGNDLEDVCDNANDEILRGVSILNSGDADGALECFKRSLTLEGSGVQRIRNKPRELSVGEKQAAFYNTACAFAYKGEIENGLLALASCLENGYGDFKQIRIDPDLQKLREDERFERVISRFEPNWFMKALNGNK